ncbi:MAG: glycosyltransferase [Chthoniobacteraceae bacterium]
MSETIPTTAPPRPAPRSYCPICGSNQLFYSFSHQSHRVMRCADCAVMFLNPQPSDADLAKIYTECYFLGHESEEGRRNTSEMKCATARQYLAELARYAGTPSGRLIEVGCGEGDFLSEAETAGYDVTGVEYAAAACATAGRRLQRGRVLQGELADAKLPDSHFDVCVLNDVIEHVRDPLAFLREIRRVLRPGGALFIATPDLRSWSARVMKERWMEWKPEHLTYFNRDNIQTALLKAGFGEVLLRPGWKILSFDYVLAHFEKFPVPVFTAALRLLAKVLPDSVREKRRRIVASGMMVFSRKAPQIRESLSVVVPAFNEAATIRPMLEALLHKEIEDLDIEVIIVESNSTDGTRAIVQEFATHPRVKLILEERPRGKGRAVRTGLAAATGTYILIQDADLEYDVEDYDSLLRPLMSGEHAFVLGSRHGGRNLWKMRQFTGQRSLSSFLNVGHLFFTTLINVLFLKRLRDPFTMFKVFRRDCLCGLHFECDRFDFDFELLIRLMQKGYTPVEIPVNYRSRSFHEGKKVSMWRDPITWLKALARLRFSKVDTMAEMERLRAVAATGQRASANQPESGTAADIHALQAK